MAGDGAKVRGQRQLRHQARAALAAERHSPAGSAWRLEAHALAAHAERVRALLAAEPDLTIAELRACLAAEGIRASPAGSAASSPPKADA